jgi:hypothetical protein
MLDKTDVKIDGANGSLKSYKDSDTKSGNSIIRQFCGNCGRCVHTDITLSGLKLISSSPVASLLSEDSPKIILKAGLFENLPPPSVKSFEQEEPSIT